MAESNVKGMENPIPPIGGTASHMFKPLMAKGVNSDGRSPCK